MRPRSARTAVIVGRPAHVPVPTVISDPMKIRRLLFKALNERECSIRVKVGDSNVLLSLRVVDAELRGAAILLEWQSAFSRATAATLASPPRDALCTWLVLAGGRGALGFRASVLDPGQGRARIECPDKVVYVQKREELRYRVPGGYEMSATLKESPRGASVTARIYDLSASGISVLLPAATTAPATIRHVTFRVHGRSIAAPVEAIAAAKSLPGGRARAEKRLRFHFIDLPEADQDLIRLFVVDHLVSLDIDSEV